MKKRLFSFVMAVVMVCGLAVTPTSAASEGLSNFRKTRTYSGQFSDVPDHAWYHDAVVAAYEYGLMQGSEGKFDPEGRITLAEAVAMAARLHSIYHGGTGQFTQGSPWYQVYADYAIENDIIPDGWITNYTAPAKRKDFAYMLANAFPERALSAINHVVHLPDVSNLDTYAPYIFRLYNAGVLTGGDVEGTFEPNTQIQRNAVATIIVRMADPTLRKELTFSSSMTAYEYLGWLAKTYGERGKYDDGGIYYEVWLMELHLFDDGFITEVKVVYNVTEDNIVLLVWDHLPDTPAGSNQYQNSICIDSSLTGPYLARSVMRKGSGEVVGGNLTVNPLTLSQNTSPTFTEASGTDSERADRLEDFIRMICKYGLPYLDFRYLRPYGYSVKDLGFASLYG